MTVKTWKVIDIGRVDLKTARCIDFDCACGTVAELPVNGLPIAQSGASLVFDTGRHAMPSKIQCRRCGRVLEREAA